MATVTGLAQAVRHASWREHAKNEPELAGFCWSACCDGSLFRKCIVLRSFFFHYSSLDNVRVLVAFLEFCQPFCMNQGAFI